MQDRPYFKSIMQVSFNNLAHSVLAVASLIGTCSQLAGESAFAAAEEPKEPLELVDFTVVDSDPLAGQTEMLNMPMDLVTGDELKRQATASLGETLDWQPGVSSTFYGPVASRPVIRGQSGYRVGVFNGGMQTGDLSSASPDHAIAQEPLFIEAVEIIRGPAALLYGSSAIGGAVNMTTKTLPRFQQSQVLKAESELRYDSAKEGRTAGITTTTTLDAMAVQVNGLVRETENYTIPGFARTADYDVTNRSRLPPGVPEPLPNSNGIVRNTQSSLRTGSIGASHFWQNGRAGAALVLYDTEYGVPTDGHAHGNPAGRTFGPGPNDVVTVEMRQRKAEASGELWPDSSWLESASFKAQSARILHEEFEGTYPGSRFDARTHDLRVELTSSEPGPWAFSGGGSLSIFELDNTNISYVAGRADTDQLSTRSLNGAFFGFAQFAQERWDAQVGTRAEFQKSERRDISNRHRSDSALSLSLGAGRRLGQTNKLGLTLSFLQRVPTADEFYVEAPHGAVGIFQISNPKLENEQSLGMDLSFTRDDGFWSLTAVGFIRKFDNYIFLENQGFEVDGLPAYRYVQREALFYGGEIESRWILIARDNAHLVLSSIWDVTIGSDSTRDEYLPRMPPMRLSARLDYKKNEWRLGVGVRHAFAQDKVPKSVFGRLDYQSPTDAYTFVDADLSYTIKNGQWAQRIFLNATNLTDNEGRSATSFLKDVAPLPGRNLAIGIEIKY